MDDRTCSEDDCDRPPYARGLCDRHYDRLRKHHRKSGTPLPPRPPSRPPRKRPPDTVVIYALLEPETSKPRYVGHSGNPARRLKEHWRRRNYGRYIKDNPAFFAWLRSLDGPPELQVLEVVPYEDRFTAEESHTDRLRQMPGADLLNIYIGARVSEATRTKMKVSHTGTKASAESRAKISAGVKAHFSQLPPDELSEMVARMNRARLGGE